MAVKDEVVNVLNPKQRQENSTAILNSLNPDKTEFNTMILGFTDIIQSSFYNYMQAQCATDREQEEMNERINNNVNEVMDVLNKKSLSNPEDMVILTTVMIEAIAKALIRQSEGGEIRISQKLNNIKKATR